MLGALEKVMMAPLLSSSIYSCIISIEISMLTRKEGKREEEEEEEEDQTFRIPTASSLSFLPSFYGRPAALSDMGMILGAIHQVACARRRLPNIEREGGREVDRGRVHDLHRVNCTFHSCYLERVLY